MKKQFISFCMFFITLILLGCAELTQAITQYALSEPMLNGYLNKHLVTPKDFDLSGIAKASLKFNSLNAKIGENAQNRVSVSGNALLGLISPLGSHNADVNLSVSARPDYNIEKGAVYLKDINLDNYKINSADLQSNQTVNLFMPYLNNALKYYFDNNPVYVLDAKNSALERWALKTANRIDVKEGRIVFNSDSLTIAK